MVNSHLINKAVFFDRDGVINKDLGYVYQKEKFIWSPGIFDVFKWLTENHFLIFIVTNQSGIGRKYYSENDFQILSNWIKKKVKEEISQLLIKLVQRLYYNLF